MSITGALTLAALAACRAATGVSARSPYLRVEIENSPISLDPRFATDALSSRIDELLFDSLVRLDGYGNFVADLAETIERPSPSELIFHLRRGVLFSDGRSLTARDVQYTYDSVIDPSVLCPKRAAFRPLARIEAMDDQTVRIVTRGPYAPALELATLGIVPRGSMPSSDPGAPPAGSGPFRLTSFLRDEQIVLERNAMRQEQPPIAGVVFKVVPDPTVRALELAKGIIDFAENNLQPDLLPYLRSRANLKVEQTAGTSYQYLAFNFRDSRLCDLRVRRAIAMAIDRDAIVHRLLDDTARVADGMLPPEHWAHDGNVIGYPYDPERSKRLLDEAGYFDPDGDGPKTRFNLVYKTTPDEERRRLAQAFQAMLAEVGIGLEIRTNEWPTFYADIQHGSFDLTSMAWVGVNDPHYYFMIFDSRMTPPEGFNRGSYSNPEMDRLLQAGDATIDPAKRRAIYAEVQRLAALDLPYLSLWWLDNVAVMNKNVAGFRPYPNGSFESFAELSLIQALPPSRR